MIPRDIGMTIHDLRLTGGETLAEKSALVANYVPILGPLASGAALQAVSSRRWDRLIMFISNVQTRLEYLERSEQLSAEQEDMTAEIFERVVKERSDERVRCYGNILVGVLTGDDWEYDQVEEYVKKIDRLTSNDIKLLSVIADPCARDEELGGEITRTADATYMGGLSTLIEVALPDWDREALVQSWDTLRSEFLLSGGYPSAMMTGNSVTLEGLRSCLSVYGRTFVEFTLTEATE